jgi:hypothetical protein
MKHELKTWPTGFQAILLGKKTHEVRPADRDFKVGDYLLLKEWKPAHEDPCSWRADCDEQQVSRDDFYCEKCKRGKDDPLPGVFTGRTCLVQVTYITPPGKFGMPKSHLVMSIERRKEVA